MSDDTVDSTSVPDWVPELRPGVRADVYPVSPPPSQSRPCELVLDREAVTAGYAEHRPPYEFGSLLGSDAVSPESLTKVRHALAGLRKAPPAAPQRVLLPESLSAPSQSAVRKPQFPLQKPSAKSSLEDWFNKLASGGAFSTATLSKAVPLGPAIVRAVGKVLEMMAARGVPTQRAVWYIRIAVLNECVKQIRPDRPAPSPRLFWTRQLASLLKAELDLLRTKKLPPAREYFWHYVLDLARWQADEGLLDLSVWLDRISASVRQDLASGKTLAAAPAARIALRAAETFAPEFSSLPLAARHLADALVTAIDGVGGPAAAASPAAAAAAAHAATAATAAASAPANVASDASGSAPVRVPPSVTTSSRLPPAVRVAALLRKIIPAALGRSAPKRLPSDLAGLVAVVRSAVPAVGSKSGAAKKESKVSSDAKWTGKVSSIGVPGPHAVSLHLERLPSSGDVAGVCDAVWSCFNANGRGGPGAAVSFLCAWAVRGPMRNSPLAVPVAATMIRALAERLAAARAPGLVAGSDVSGGSVSGSSHRKNVIPIFQGEVWVYVKKLDERRKGAASGTTGCEGSNGQTSAADESGGSQQDCHGFFVDPTGAEVEDLRMVRLLAQLYRLGQFSLGAYLKEVSRLVSCSHRSSRRHLLYVSALPEPSSRASADTRRSLLRRGRRFVGTPLSSRGADERVLQTVDSCDVGMSVGLGRQIRSIEPLSTVLATAEGVLGLDDAKVESPEGRVLSVVGFLSAAGAELLAVEWLVRVMRIRGSCREDFAAPSTGGPMGCSDTSPLLGDSKAVCAMVHALDNLAQCVAASGSLYIVLQRLSGLHAMYESKVDCSLSERNDVLAAVESTASSYSATFAPNSGSANTSWAAEVARMSTALPSSPRLVGILLLGRPAGDGEISEATLAALRGDLDAKVAARPSRTSPPVHDSSADLCWGPTPDEDLDLMVKHAGQSAGLKSLADFVSFRGSQEEEQSPPGLGSWATVNAVVAGVVVPEIKKAFGAKDDVVHLKNVISSSLELLSDGLYDHDLCGARSTVVLELIAALAAVSLTVLPAAGEHLAVLLSKEWVKQCLLPRSGAGMIRRLRSRIEKLVGKDADSRAISRLVCDSVSALYGAPLLVGESQIVDEAVVVQLFGWTEWGVSECFLSAFAAHKHACGQIAEFGHAVGRAAAGIQFCEQAEVLVDIIVRSVPKEKLSLVVAAMGVTSREGLAECLEAIVVHVIMDSSAGAGTVSQAEREAWAAFDSTRCTIVTALAPHICLPHDSITGILQQLAATSAKLEAAGRELQPDLSSNGAMFSTAIESRFKLLNSLAARSRSSDVLGKGEDDSDLQSQMCDIAVVISEVMAAAPCLLYPSAITEGLRAVGTAVSAAETQGPALVSAGDVGVHAEDGEVGSTVPLRSRVGSILEPLDMWLDDVQKATLRVLCTPVLSRGSTDVSRGHVGIRHPIVASKPNGTDLDPWYLLEGYGCGIDEEAAIPLSAFNLQGIRSLHRSSASNVLSSKAGDAGTQPRSAGVVSRLKRTYSTYSCMTVR